MNEFDSFFMSLFSIFLKSSYICLVFFIIRWQARKVFKEEMKKLEDKKYEQEKKISDFNKRKEQERIKKQKIIDNHNNSEGIILTNTKN